jgi:hypothetical protein
MELSLNVYTDVKFLHTWGARYLKVADSGPLPRRDGCGFSSSRATAAARIPMADSAGGKLEWPGFPDTLSSRVAVPFSEMPTLTSKQSAAYNLQATCKYGLCNQENIHFYIIKFYKFGAFWDVASYSHIEAHRHFRGGYYLHHQGDYQHGTLMMEAVHTSETWFTSTVRLHGAISQKAVIFIVGNITNNLI